MTASSQGMPGAVTDCLHPIRPGNRGCAYRLYLPRRPFSEPLTIVCPVPDVADHYFVRLDSEPQLLRQRLVLPGDWADQSDRMLKALHAYWRASLDPTLGGALMDMS